MEIFFVGSNFARLAQGVLLTLQIALVSIVLATLGGLLLGFVMSAKNIFVRGVCRFYLECVRIIPILAWLFIVFFGISQLFDINLNAVTSAIIVFSLWGVAEVGDLVRGAITSLPKHQSESGRALGLKQWQIMLYIILPQALQRLLPSLISLSTRMIKTTSLVALLGAVDLLKVGQQIIELNKSNPNASFWVYGGIFCTYFILCYPLSYLSKRLEKTYQ
ncbi:MULTISPECIES: amino acid ABC transporter permease [Helicobacter]|uniref:Amino acid ABC transporter permease n=3 Tax=Helicobacter typhlonius TaxID=76936 RepID=A0A099UEL5_9HELI|nr:MULTISPECIES: amino acid ABC transporter permease [Helicobacter]TLD78421.1 amino acid ABC transporter permease [Helicobacter typhlonius]TLD88727.1 amino acid ABC transporter permease [Helicobacter sp. MIT 03-1616]CUU39654.1 Amino acid ABC transporter, permease protein [Helicobacter typhlonius]